MHRPSKITFLGAGRLARALIEGLLKTKTLDPHQILITSRSGVSAKKLAEELNITAILSHDQAIEKASVILLCTKPAQALEAIMASQKSFANKILISMAAGIRSEDLFQASGRLARIIRAMPNTAVRVGKGTITLSPHSSATQEDLLLVKNLFSKSATLEEVSEENMNAVTAISGSGPAFALLFLEAFLDAGIKAGLTPKLARSLAAHTLEAAAALALHTETSPQSLRQEITSPQGTTAAGLQVLEEAEWTGTIEKAIEAASNRASELAEKR
jgi:pyrroline-5-carboxylate reductase